MIDVEVIVSEKARTLAGRLGRSVVRDMAATILRGAHVAAGVMSQVVDSTFKSGKRELSRSFIANVGFVSQSDDEVSARTFSPLPYARIQSLGGTIKPRTAKNLAIPLTPAAIARMPRDWAADQLKAIVLRGKVFLVERQGKGLLFHYVLKPEVTITGTGYVAEAEKRSRPLVDQVIRAGLKQLIAEGSGV